MADLFKSKKFRGLLDCISYCEVFNYHLSKEVRFYSGIVSTLLAHNKALIFDGTTNKGHIINLDKFDSLEDGLRYFHNQTKRFELKNKQLDLGEKEYTRIYNNLKKDYKDFLSSFED